MSGPVVDNGPASLVASLFRHESGRLVASLTRLFGPHHIDLAEDVVQEALETALQAWKFKIPDHPSAWLSRVARNRALDIIRHGGIERRYADEHQALLSSEWSLAPTVDEALAEAHAPDNLLRLMFTVCQPQLSEDTQVTLILKFLCGFASSEIAAAFLTSEQTIAKRLQRGRAVLRELPSLAPTVVAEADAARLETVLGALYLLFNEGYHGSHPTTPTRAVLCDEALRLCALITEQRDDGAPAAHALMALMCFHRARLATRLDDEGIYVPLVRQDRTVWDRALIERGVAHLQRSASGATVSAWHLEAGIAGQHTLAPSVAETDWPAVVALYDLLHARHASPVIALNRALCRAYAGEVSVALTEVLALGEEALLDNYPFYWAARGEIHARAAQAEQAQRCYQHAASLARSAPEQQAFLRNARALTEI